MEKEKLENQEIEEIEVENVAGGGKIIKYPFIKNAVIELDPEEEDILTKANLFNSKNGVGYIKKSDIKKAKDVLEKAGKKLKEENCKTFLGF